MSGIEYALHFPLDADQPVEVRLYFASGFDGASEPGQRLFDVMIDNALVLDNYDIVSDVGHKVGVIDPQRLLQPGEP